MNTQECISGNYYWGSKNECYSKLAFDHILEELKEYNLTDKNKEVLASWLKLDTKKFLRCEGCTCRPNLGINYPREIEVATSFLTNMFNKNIFKPFFTTEEATKYMLENPDVDFILRLSTTCTLCATITLRYPQDKQKIFHRRTSIIHDRANTGAFDWSFYVDGSQFSTWKTIEKDLRGYLYGVDTNMAFRSISS